MQLFLCTSGKMSLADRGGNMIQHSPRDDGMRRSCLLCPKCVFGQTSVWKQSLVLICIFQATFILVPPVQMFKEIGTEWGSGGFSEKSKFLPPPHQHWPSSSMQSLYMWSIGNTRVQPPGGSVHLALCLVSCKPPLWEVSLGPGSGRWSGSGASGHL